MFIATLFTIANYRSILELSPKKKRCPSHHRGLECKSRKSRDRWSNRQRLIEFSQENALVIANTLFQQHKRRLPSGSCGVIYF